MIRCRGHMTRWKAKPFSRRGLIYVRSRGFFLNALFLMLREGEKELGLTKLLQVLEALGRVVLFLLAVVIEFARIVGGEC